MTRLIADDFAAIRARLVNIRAAEGAKPADPRTVPPPEVPADPARPADFHTWLGGLLAAPAEP